MIDIHYDDENKGGDHQEKDVLIFRQILLTSSIGFQSNRGFIQVKFVHHHLHDWPKRIVWKRGLGRGPMFFFYYYS